MPRRSNLRRRVRLARAFLCQLGLQGATTKRGMDQGETRKNTVSRAPADRQLWGSAICRWWQSSEPYTKILIKYKIKKIIIKIVINMKTTILINQH